jgi:hypothetical protein
MTRQGLVKSLLGVLTASCLAVLGCGARSDGLATDTKTNWLANCKDEDDCAEGLACACGVCTVGCDSDTTCASFDSKAECFHPDCASGGVCALLETSLEGNHSGLFENCPRSAEDYRLERGECPDTLDCGAGTLPFEDECGCGCAPDPECDADAPYVANAIDCGLIVFTCDPGDTRFDDSCGCGCKAINPVPTCSQPVERYVATAAGCANTDFDVDCEEGVWFEDDCGCGCTLPTDAECPGERDYSLLGDACQNAAIDCSEGYVNFEDACGCGCEPEPVCDPSVDYVVYGGCEGVDFDCEEGQQPIIDTCGCGCKAMDAAVECPRVDDAYSQLGARCDAVEINCAVETIYFRDECGCGCEPNPACDPDVTYLNHGSCEEFEFECELGDVAVTDDCGCGCTRNPACDPDSAYVGCAGATIGCEEGTEFVWDDCGCRCEPVLDTLGDAGVDGCAAPEGTPLETALVLRVECTQVGPDAQTVSTQEQLQAALAACAPEGEYADVRYDGVPLFVQVVPTKEAVRHVYTVQTTERCRLGLQYPQPCDGPSDVHVLLLFEIAGLNVGSVVETEVCGGEECSDE